jgi:hypothetical protein
MSNDSTYLRLTSKFIDPVADFDSDDDSNCSDSLFDDLRGLHALDTLTKIVRDMLIGPISEYHKKEYDGFLSYFDSIKANFQPPLLKEFLSCDNFPERLGKIQEQRFPQIRLF